MFDCVQYILTRNPPPKRGVLPVQPLEFPQANEEMAARSVGIFRPGHRKDPPLVRDRPKFARDKLRIQLLILRRKRPALGNKARKNPVEEAGLFHPETRFRQLQEVRDRKRCDFRIELKNQVPKEVSINTLGLFIVRSLSRRLDPAALLIADQHPVPPERRPQSDQQVQVIPQLPGGSAAIAADLRTVG